MQQVWLVCIIHSTYFTELQIASKLEMVTELRLDVLELTKSLTAVSTGLLDLRIEVSCACESEGDHVSVLLKVCAS